MSLYDDDDRPAPADVPGLPARVLDARSARSGWVYSPALGEAIAEQYAECDAGGGLWELRALSPDRIPPPAVVRAWCKQYPAFGLLMKEAEKVRAESMVEQAIVIADTAPANLAPARIALQISARHYMAEKLDAARYGRSATNGHSPALLPRDAQPVALEISDEALAAIALAGSGPADGAQG